MGPIISPSLTPSILPTDFLTKVPTDKPSVSPTGGPTVTPTSFTSSTQTEFEFFSTELPSLNPTPAPSSMPSFSPTEIPTTRSTEPTLPKCKDKMSKIKFKLGGKIKQWTCQKIKKKRRCKKKEMDTGNPLWSLCPVSCQKGIPIKKLQNLSCIF